MEGGKDRGRGCRERGRKGGRKRMERSGRVEG